MRLYNRSTLLGFRSALLGFFCTSLYNCFRSATVPNQDRIFFNIFQYFSCVQYFSFGKNIISPSEDCIFTGHIHNVNSYTYTYSYTYTMFEQKMTYLTVLLFMENRKYGIHAVLEKRIFLNSIFNAYFFLGTSCPKKKKRIYFRCFLKTPKVYGRFFFCPFRQKISLHLFLGARITVLLLLVCGII